MTPIDAPRVALATYAAAPALTDDDALVAQSLRARGAHCAAFAWDDGTVDWSRHDVVVVRSCWDYHLRPAAFGAWIDRLEADGVDVRNAPAVLRWNADKRYLRDVEAAGVPIVPTRWTMPGDRPRLPDILDETGWERVVVKPAVSAQAHDTWRASAASLPDDAPRFAAQAAREPVLVQPFVDAIVRDGEWSLLFFGGAFSHAVRKWPGDGDFRVQREHGGRHARAEPDAALVDAARRALATAPAPTTYARVDGCVVDGVFRVMELELLEPSLYLADADAAAARFAEAILAGGRSAD